jgi:hypothetical protein
MCGNACGWDQESRIFLLVNFVLGTDESDEKYPASFNNLGRHGARHRPHRRSGQSADEKTMTPEYERKSPDDPEKRYEIYEKR